MAHAFRFSVDYLIHLNLLYVGNEDKPVQDSRSQAPIGARSAQQVNIDGQLEPNDLAAFVAHLFFMEPSNFAFLSLLTYDKGSVMCHLCRPSSKREERVLAVLCNIFCRTSLRRDMAEYARAFPASTGPSKVILESLDDIEGGSRLKKILREHNYDALKKLVGYWTCFVEAYNEQLGDDDTLPISGCR